MSTTQTLGVSFAMGFCLFGITILFGWASIVYRLNSSIFKWIVLPILGYCIAIGLNSIVQYASCGTVHVLNIVQGSLPVLYCIVGFLLLTLLGFVRAPIVSAVPSIYQVRYGGLFALGFYMFWAGMFGEAFAGGFAQGCAA